MAENFDNLDKFILECIKCNLRNCEENKIFSPYEPFVSIIPLLEYLKPEFTDLREKLLGIPADPEINDTIKFFSSLSETCKSYESRTLIAIGGDNITPIKIPSNLTIDQASVNFHHVKTTDFINNKLKLKDKNEINKNIVESCSEIMIATTSTISATWLNQFITNATKLADFTLLTGNKIQIETMETIGNFEYCESENFNAKFINVEFKESDIFIIFALPNKHDGIGHLKNTLFSKSLMEFATSLIELEFEQKKIKLNMPRISFSSESSFKGTFENIGFSDFFTNEKVFQGICDQKNLKIDNIYQKMEVKIDEKGFGHMNESASQNAFDIENDDTLQFNMNHPFMFVVMSNLSKCPIYIGQVYNPGEN